MSCCPLRVAIIAFIYLLQASVVVPATETPNSIFQRHCRGDRESSRAVIEKLECESVAEGVWLNTPGASVEQVIRYHYKFSASLHKVQFV